MIERHVTFDVFPEKSQEFEKLFVEEYRPAMANMPGYIKVELLRKGKTYDGRGQRIQRRNPL